MLYFENRKLKKEILELENDITRQKDIVIEAKSNSYKLERESADFIRKIDKLELENKKLKAVVRQQTGADLLVNALCELGVIPKPEKDTDSFKRQDALLQQMGTARNANYNLGQYNPQYAGLGGILGGIA